MTSRQLKSLVTAYWPGSDRSSSPAEEEIRHSVPRMPISIDGEEVDPRVVAELDGVPLYSVVDKDAVEGKMLHIYTERDRAKDHIRSWDPNTWRLAQAASPLLSALTMPSPGKGFIRFCKHIYLQGRSWVLYEPDLTENDFRDLKSGGTSVKVFGKMLLSWGKEDANDKVSSFIVHASIKGVLVLYEHIRAGGSEKWFLGNHIEMDLRKYGWNDRASSCQFIPLE